MGSKVKQHSAHKDSGRTSSRSGLTSPQQDGYRFTLVNGQVSSLQEYEGGSWKNEKIGRNESWSFDGSTLTKTETERGRVKISTYLDADGDGVFTRSGRDAVTGIGLGGGSGSSHPSYGSNPSLEDSYRFSLVNGQVTNLQEYEKGRWKNEAIGQNESWSFDGTNLIQQEIKGYGMEVSTYSDPDMDGIFSKVSEVLNPALSSFSEARL
jgi:hypothetical protein